MLTIHFSGYWLLPSIFIVNWFELSLPLFSVWTICSIKKTTTIFWPLAIECWSILIMMMMITMAFLINTINAFLDACWWCSLSLYTSIHIFSLKCPSACNKYFPLFHFLFKYINWWIQIKFIDQKKKCYFHRSRLLPFPFKSLFFFFLLRYNFIQK